MTLTGTSFLTWGLFITKQKAIELGVSRSCSDNDNENLELPAVKDRVKQSRNAIIGYAFVFLGSILQIICVLNQN
jgi:hypothetical protein